MDFSLGAELELVQQTTREFARDLLAPQQRHFEAERAVPDEVRARYTEIGLQGVELPERLGGTDLGALARAVILEELGAADPGAALALDPLGPALYPLLEMAPAESLDALVAPLLGEPGARAVLAWSERDVLTLNGRGRRGHDDDPILGRATGRLPWVPADRVDLLVVLSPDGGFAVRDGIELRPLRGSGLRAAGASEVHLSDAPVIAHWPDPEGSARALARARVHLAALLVGVLRGAAEFSREYALERVAFGRPIAHHQALAFLIADMRSSVDGARLLVQEAAWRIDRGLPAAESAALAFAEAAESATFVAPNAVQILGGHGFMQDYPVEKFMREARTLGLTLGGIDAAREDAGRSLCERELPMELEAPGGLMDFRIDTETAKRLTGLRELGRKEIRPLGLEADRLGRPTPPEHPFFELMLEIGLGRTRWSPERDAPAPGITGSSRTTLLLAEEQSYWDRGVAVSVPGPGLGEPPVLSMGTPEQRQRFLGPFVSPEKPRWGSFAMSEPGAGSDVAAIQTRARPDRDHWILNGDKSFAANASRADWIVVWATVDPELGRAGHRAFIVERDTPGLGDFKIERKMGLKAYESTSFTLRDCRVPAANLLGGEERYVRRAGFKGALGAFNATRPMIGAMAVGIGRAALDESLAFAREHDRLGDPRVRDRLERVRRKLQMARLLCLRAAWLADHQQPNMVEASMAKAVAPGVAFEAASLGMELLGSEGARGDHLIEKLFRDVKAMDIVEGTGQIQRLIMARHLVNLPRG